MTLKVASIISLREAEKQKIGKERQRQTDRQTEQNLYLNTVYLIDIILQNIIDYALQENHLQTVVIKNIEKTIQRHGVSWNLEMYSTKRGGKGEGGRKEDRDGDIDRETAPPPPSLSRSLALSLSRSLSLSLSGREEGRERERERENACA